MKVSNTGHMLGTFSKAVSQSLSPLALSSRFKAMHVCSPVRSLHVCLTYTVLYPARFQNLHSTPACRSASRLLKQMPAVLHPCDSRLSNEQTLETSRGFQQGVCKWNHGIARAMRSGWACCLHSLKKSKLTRRNDHILIKTQTIAFLHSHSLSSA